MTFWEFLQTGPGVLTLCSIPAAVVVTRFLDWIGTPMADSDKPEIEPLPASILEIIQKGMEDVKMLERERCLVILRNVEDLEIAIALIEEKIKP